MSSTMEYKGYVGNVDFSEEDGVFHGKVQGIRSLISYEGESASDLVKDFHDAVDDYLNLCKNRGTEPEKAYKGTFNVRISPSLHKTVALYAHEHNVSLNSVVESAIRVYVKDAI